MKLIIVVFLSCITFPLFSSYKTSCFDTSIKRFNYIKIKRDYFKHYPPHIQYCKYVLYDPGRHLKIRIKKLNKILNGIDTIYHLNICYLKGFNSYKEIPALMKVNSAVVTYKTANDIDIFSLKNLNELWVVTRDQKRLSINQINYNLNFLSTTNPLDSTLLNLTGLDSLFWKSSQLDSLSGRYISNHPHIQFLKISVLSEFTSREDINKIINILSKSKSISKFEMYNWRFEEGSILILEEFCKKNKIKLVLPLKYIEKPIKEW